MLYPAFAFRVSLAWLPCLENHPGLLLLQNQASPLVVLEAFPDLSARTLCDPFRGSLGCSAISLFFRIYFPLLCTLQKFTAEDLLNKDRRKSSKSSHRVEVRWSCGPRCVLPALVWQCTVLPGDCDLTWRWVSSWHPSLIGVMGCSGASESSVVYPSPIPVPCCDSV